MVLVLDGEIIPSIDNKPLPFALLQTRIGRKNITKKNLQEAPIAFFAYDLLEYEGEDFREQPLETRRRLLEKIVGEINHPVMILSPVIEFRQLGTIIAYTGQFARYGSGRNNVEKKIIRLPGWQKSGRLVEMEN